MNSSTPASLLLDVRSPAEYESGHIPGAKSFPLFSDKERADVGITYKQLGRLEAVKKGLELTGPKLSGFVDEAQKWGVRELSLYCWRGGMRSESMGWLLRQAGFEVYVLPGGYKTYRRQLLDFFEQSLPLLILTGYTGSQKTLLLKELRSMGSQSVDLEGLANHQGSSFGNRKSTGQPSSEHFQNLIYEEFKKLDLEKPIWLEDECLRIGQVTVIESLFRQMCRSPHIFLKMDKDSRTRFLVREYGELTLEQLAQATDSIKKKLGFDKAKRAIELIYNRQLEDAASIILDYYDAFYEKSIQKKKKLVIEYIHSGNKEIVSLARELHEKYQNGISPYTI